MGRKAAKLKELNSIALRLILRLRIKLTLCAVRLIRRVNLYAELLKGVKYLYSYFTVFLSRYFKKIPVSKMVHKQLFCPQDFSAAFAQVLQVLKML